MADCRLKNYLIIRTRHCRTPLPLYCHIAGEGNQVVARATNFLSLMTSNVACAKTEAHRHQSTIINRQSSMSALGMQVVGHQGFRPEGNPHFGNLARGEERLHLTGGKQSQFLDSAFGNVGA